MAGTSNLVLISSILLLVVINNPSCSEGGNVLYTVNTIYPGQFLKYHDYQVTLQQDCNLVLCEGTKPIWSTGTKAALCYLTMQNNGDLVLYDASKKRIWGSGKTGPVGTYVFALQKDRNLVVYGPSTWSTGTAVAVPSNPTDTDMRGENCLIPGEILFPGNSLKNGKWELKMQYDCNLVLYENGDKVIWASNTGGKADVCYLKMERSGALVLYNGSGGRVWATNTAAGLSTLVLQKDRNVVIYGPPIWASGTVKAGLGFPLNDPKNTTYLPYDEK